MAIIVPREGLHAMLGILLTRTSDPETLVLRLFRNPVTKTREARLADFTEATFRGYTPVALAPSGWRRRPDGAEHREHAFRCAADPEIAEPVYGYYLTGANTDRLYWFERFREAFEVARATDEIAVTPRLQTKRLRPKEDQG